MAARLFAILLTLVLTAFSAQAQHRQPIADAHIHYSHDAWSVVPPAAAIAILKQAGVAMAFVSSSSDEGTQKLYRLAPDLVVPILRPYRKRGETGSWYRDPTIIDYVEARLKANIYAGIGEFHVNGEDADLPVVRRMVELARDKGIFLQAHSDAAAVQRMFAQDPQARILWAHCGFEPLGTIRAMLNKHDNLWCDLSFRSEHDRGGILDPDWRQVFMDFPDRFMLGTDTYTPDRWSYVVEYADRARDWLKDLPPDVALRIAMGNARKLAAWAGWK